MKIIEGNGEEEGGLVLQERELKDKYFYGEGKRKEMDGNHAGKSHGFWSDCKKSNKLCKKRSILDSLYSISIGIDLY
jgi:hypothetical protein